MYVSMEVSCSTEKVLEILRTNRQKHIELVQDSKLGYLKLAKQALIAKLEDIQAGKVVELSFRLPLPKDYTYEYDTAIHMLEMHTDTTVTLGSEAVKCLIENQWNWRDFVNTNEVYSPMFLSQDLNLPE
jgi:hypothetical protein